MIFRLTCVKENFEGVFARVSMASDQLHFASLEIDKSYSLSLPPWKNLCHRWSRDQPRPGSLFQRPREEEERDPGNEVGHKGPITKPIGKLEKTYVSIVTKFVTKT